MQLKKQIQRFLKAKLRNDKDAKVLMIFGQLIFASSIDDEAERKIWCNNSFPISSRYKVPRYLFFAIN